MRNHIVVSPNILESHFHQFGKKSSHNISAEVIFDRIIISW